MVLEHITKYLYLSIGEMPRDKIFNYQLVSVQKTNYKLNGKYKKITFYFFSGFTFFLVVIEIETLHWWA
jgi:hypothetical protein